MTAGGAWRGERMPPRRLLVPAAWTAAAMATGVVALAAGSPWPLLGLPALAVPLARMWGGAWPAAALAVLAAVAGTVGVVLAGAPGAAGMVAASGLAAAAGARWRREVEALAGRVAAAEQRADAVGVHDELTGCANQLGLSLLGKQVLHDVRRRGDAAHAVLLEVAGLDDVRRRCGDQACKEIVAAVAEALGAGTRDTDVVARWSADTFAVVGPGGGAAPAELERRVRVHLLDQPPVAPAQWPCRVTAGAGVLEPWDAGSLDDLLHRAEQDLSMRRALRAPSAPEPPTRGRR